MICRARILAPALRTYQGVTTTPERWSTWTPRPGDIVVCTPPKCGTTWTQTILTMLVHGGAELPNRVSILSPWVDADHGVAAENVAAALDAQPGRRVVKTHTPADGFPIWEGVTVIAVYRHPLDVFFSMRKHMANTQNVVSDFEHWLLPVRQSFLNFIDTEDDLHHFGRDTLAEITTHYRETVCSDRVRDLQVFHYADMLRDGRRAVEDLARAAGIDARASLIDRVAEATAFGTMKGKAADYAPFGGTGHWKSDADFFDSARSRKWEGRLSDEALELYRARLAELVPDEGARTWLENGVGRCPWQSCRKGVRDSSREFTVIAGAHEQTITPDLQDQELASL